MDKSPRPAEDLSLKKVPSGTFHPTHLGSDEQARDADQLQLVLADVLLLREISIQIVDGEVVSLAVELVHLAHFD